MAEPSLEDLAFMKMRECPHAAALGMETVSLEPSIANLRVAYRPELVGDPDSGVIAGGVVTALLDHCCGQSVMAALGAPTPIATLDLRIDYMRGAEPGLDIQARAHCYRVAHAVAFVRATAYDRALEDPIATAQAVFMLTGPAEAPSPDGAS